MPNSISWCFVEMLCITLNSLFHCLSYLSQNISNKSSSISLTLYVVDSVSKGFLTFKNSLCNVTIPSKVMNASRMELNVGDKNNSQMPCTRNQLSQKPVREAGKLANDIPNGFWNCAKGTKSNSKKHAVFDDKLNNE